jgi:hypothetical protein
MPTPHAASPEALPFIVLLDPSRTLLEGARRRSPPIDQVD